MIRSFRKSFTGKTQADGVFTVEKEKIEHIRHTEIQIEVSATPAAGTLAVGVRLPGASTFQTIDTIDLTGSSLIVQYDGIVDAFQLFQSLAGNSSFAASETLSETSNHEMFQSLAGNSSFAAMEMRLWCLCRKFVSIPCREFFFCRR